jgi:hypothetical protein
MADARLVKLLPAPPVRGTGWRTDRRTGRSTTAKHLRPPPLSERKAKVARLLAGVPTAIAFNEPTDRDGAVAFQCRVRARGHRIEAAQRA